MNSEFNRILLIHFRPIGDVLLSTPLISLLRKRFAGAHIAFMVEPLPGQVLENNPDLDEIIYYRHKKDDIVGSYRFFRAVGKRGWDLVIDLYGTPGAAWATLFTRAKVRVGYTFRVRKYAYTHRVNHLLPERYSALKKLALIKAVGINEESAELTLHLVESEREFAARYFQQNKIDRDRLTVCLAPGAKRRIRAWRTVEWARLGDMLRENFHANVVIVWGPGEEETVKQVADAMNCDPFIIPLTNLKEMAAIIERSHLFISNDSGPKHIATAVGVPTITVYGPTSPSAWTYPDRQRHRFVRGDVPCIGCNRRVCMFAQDSPEHMCCMEAVSAEDVVNEMRKIPELHKVLTGEFMHEKGS